MINNYFHIKAPAKINIGLKILSKRTDGYHNLETIFYPVNLCDNVSIQIIKRKSTNLYSIAGRPKGLIPDKDNSCYKALLLFLEEFGIKGYYKINIYLSKNIPIGAGLGGGSSDAAAVLKGLYNYFEILDREDSLQKIALKLGSDVPFFLINKPAYAISRGEKIKLLDGFNINGNILIIYPGINIPTKWAFNEIDKMKASKTREIKSDKILNRLIKGEGIKDVKELDAFKNDFEEVIFKKYPEIASIKETLLNYGAEYASMSGSGSAVYGIFTYDSRKVQFYFKEKGYEVFLV